MLVLPAAVGAFFGVQLLNILCTYFALPNFMSWIVQFFNCWAGSIAFVLAGAATAPTGKRFVSGVLAFLNLALVGILTTVIFMAERLPDERPKWWIAICAVISIAGGFAGMAQTYSSWPPKHLNN